MVNWNNKKLGDFLLLANGTMFLVLLVLLSERFFFRLDMTEERRYSLKQPTLELLNNLDEDVFVEVFLAGNLNAGFKRLQKSIEDLLEEFRIASDNHIRYTFTNPQSAASQKARNEFMNDLASRGINPMNVIDTHEGQRIENLVFPGAIINLDGFETSVMLLKGNRALSSDEVINQSIEGLEYELANSIFQLVNTDRKRIGLLQGHGELDSLDIASFNNALLDSYDVYKVDLSRKSSIENYDLLIMMKPTASFSASDKYKLDQYVMRGGRLLLLIDKLDAVMDSASRQDYFAFPYELNLDDLLFKYGIRINPDLIQDIVSARYPIVTGQVGNRPQIMQMEWPFFPLANQYAAHSITRNLDASMLQFVSSLDTVRADGIKKTPLIFTSTTSRKISAPVNVSVNHLRSNLDPAQFNTGPLPVAYLLEGQFTSLFKDRFLPEGVPAEQLLEKSIATSMIVVSDGDLPRNVINPRTKQPQQLGFDPISGYTFANEELLLNMVAYLVQQEGLINVRNKEVKLRPLNKLEIQEQRLYWQVLNLLVPLIVLIIYGVLRFTHRRHKFAKR